MNNISNPATPQALTSAIKQWALASGFTAVGISGIDTAAARPYLEKWLDQGFHGEMHYLAAHGLQRLDPTYLLPEAASVIAVALPYLSGAQAAQQAWQTLHSPDRAYVARYALGRDYHKVMRQALKQLAARILDAAPQARLRLAVDSAPLPEVELAVKAGLGWRGKHTLLLNRTGGSFFFLGEIVTDLPLIEDAPVSAHCGSCTRCIDICPTKAIIAPYQLDARRCIAYLTIELAASIPKELRVLIGNRIYGCDDCQLICPWNKFAGAAVPADFAARHRLDELGLLEAFSWSAERFDAVTIGSPIRRIGHARWLRNVAVALGNLPPSAFMMEKIKFLLRELSARLPDPDELALVSEHLDWALEQHRLRLIESSAQA